MAVANNWEVLITRGIISAPKTEIIMPPIEPPVSRERFTWRTTSRWIQAGNNGTGNSDQKVTGQFRGLKVQRGKIKMNKGGNNGFKNKLSNK